MSGINSLSGYEQVICPVFGGAMQHAPISRARSVQENRKMRFLEAYDGWNEDRQTQTQAEAAQILGQCEEGVEVFRNFYL